MKMMNLGMRREAKKKKGGGGEEEKKRRRRKIYCEENETDDKFRWQTKLKIKRK